MTETMNQQTITVGNFTLQIRKDRAEQDMDIVKEVLLGDTYRLHGMKEAGFEPQTIVSIGSHIGTFEMLAHSLWPNAKVVSVEPNKESFELLKRNAPFSSAYNVAIAYQKEVILTDGQGSTGGGFITTKDELEQRSGYDPSTGRVTENQEKGWYYTIADERVEAMSLEQLVNAEQLSTIDLLKMDCEGGEWAIMEHLPMPGLTIKYIVGEYHMHPF